MHGPGNFSVTALDPSPYIRHTCPLPLTVPPMTRLPSLLLPWLLSACAVPAPKEGSEPPPGSPADSADPDPTPDDSAAPADTGNAPPETDPWPDASTLPDGVLSLVYDGEVVTSGQTIRVQTAPAGLPDRTHLRFVLTNRTETSLTLPADGAAWLTGEAFAWASPPPTLLAPEESVALELSIGVQEETAARVHEATLTIPGGPSVQLEGEVPRPLRVVVVGSGHYTAASDSYGASFETEVHAEDATTARDVVWGAGRFFRSDRAYNDWNAPGVYQYSDDGVTWHDATTSEEFWVSDCTHAAGRFYCVRSSSWTSSDDGSIVLHNANGWGQLLNGVVFVPGEEVGRPADTTDPEALLAGDRFVAVGRMGRRMLSTDGASWTADVTSTTTVSYYNHLAYADGMVVAVGGSDNLETAVSLDGGETWTETVLCTDQWATFHTVVHGNGLFLATGQSNACDQIWSSSDGLSWTGLSRERVTVLTFTNGWFIGVTEPWGQPATLVRSTDGVTWDAVHSVPEGVDIQAATVEQWSAP